MKRKFSALLAFALILCWFSLPASAADTCKIPESFVPCRCGEHCTHAEGEVEIIMPAGISDALSAKITALINGEAPAEQKGLMCDLFGHKYEEYQRIPAIIHKDAPTPPRCLVVYRDYFTCTRCGAYTYNLYNSYYIDCCP
ncbi:MAG: hypothetical protein GX851_00755 [Clostridiales bacterium]|nr:hypothetical protein [Clostridiales bacterium]